MFFEWKVVEVKTEERHFKDIVLSYCMWNRRYQFFLFFFSFLHNFVFVHQTTNWFIEQVIVRLIDDENNRLLYPWEHEICSLLEAIKLQRYLVNQSLVFGCFYGLYLVSHIADFISVREQIQIIFSDIYILYSGCFSLECFGRWGETLSWVS